MRPQVASRVAGRVRMPDGIRNFGARSRSRDLADVGAVATAAASNRWSQPLPFALQGHRSDLVTVQPERHEATIAAAGDHARAQMLRPHVVGAALARFGAQL